MRCRGNRVSELTCTAGEFAVAFIHLIADGDKILSPFEFGVMQPRAFADAVATLLFAVTRQMVMSFSGMSKHPCTSNLLVQRLSWQEKPLFCTLADECD